MGRVYNLAEWRRVRERVLASEPLCRMCLAVGRREPARHVDHIQPIASGGSWFDADNLQALCHEHHSQKTAAEQGHVARMGCGMDGLPLDPTHHWRRG